MFLGRLHDMFKASWTRFGRQKNCYSHYLFKSTRRQDIILSTRLQDIILPTRCLQDVFEANQCLLRQYFIDSEVHLSTFMKSIKIFCFVCLFVCLFCHSIYKPEQLEPKSSN